MRNIIIFIVILIIIIKLSFLNKKQNKEPFDNINKKPYLWVYWENIGDNKTYPPYIDLCLQTIFKHCSTDFNLVLLDEKSILNYLPELEEKKKKYKLDRLIIQHRVDYYRVLLLNKYGGLYLDADTLVMKNPIEIINKLKDFDYVGFGCTGIKCTNGYGKPSNAIMASRQNGQLISQVEKNLENRLLNRDKFDYFDLGKLVIWEELDKLVKDNYKYYHYDNHYDGTRDKEGNWMTNDYFFTDKKIDYLHPDDLIFVLLYNSEMKDYKNKSKEELIKENTNFSKFIKKSLNI
jgi:hypothetical protein